jgi:hypothetical protein
MVILQISRIFWIGKDTQAVELAKIIEIGKKTARNNVTQLDLFFFYLIGALFARSYSHWWFRSLLYFLWREDSLEWPSSWIIFHLKPFMSFQFKEKQSFLL